MKELTVLEKLLVQILIHTIDTAANRDYVLKVLQRAGLSKQQAVRALED